MFFKKKEVEQSSSQEGENQDSVSAPKLSKKLDNLNKKLEASVEYRKTINDKFSNVNMTIGEVKNNLMQKDKKLSKLEASIEKATGVVEAVKPENFMIDIKKLEASIESLKGKVTGTETIFDNMLNEIKQIKRKIGLIHGVEDILKLKDDVAHQLNDIQQVQARVGASADKVEGMFIEAQKKFDQYKQMDDKISDAKKEIGQVKSQLNEDEAKISKTAKKSEFEHLKSESDKILNKLKLECKKHGIDIDSISDKENIISYDDKIKDIDSKIEEFEKKISDLTKHVEEFSK